MIHELRMYTCKPGTIAKVLEASGTVARRIREGDRYGVLEGHFSSEIGPLNRFVHMWRYEDMGEMARLRGELGRLEAWRSDYVPLIRPNILEQTVRILNPVRPMADPEGEGNLYELRIYRLPPGGAAPWAEKMAAALPAREKYSKNIGLWVTQLPDPNEVVHLWSYPDFGARMEARRASQADPEWSAFLAANVSALQTMTSTLLLPSAWSPRK